jgi:hypothetical protein
VFGRLAVSEKENPVRHGDHGVFAPYMGRLDLHWKTAFPLKQPVCWARAHPNPCCCAMMPNDGFLRALTIELPAWQVSRCWRVGEPVRYVRLIMCVQTSISTADTNTFGVSPKQRTPHDHGNTTYACRPALRLHQPLTMGSPVGIINSGTVT